jgi:hypothetical protein
VIQDEKYASFKEVNAIISKHKLRKLPGAQMSAIELFAHLFFLVLSGKIAFFGFG